MEQVWASRLRWRLRGATLWPAFAAFVVGDAVLMHFRPISGDRGPDWFPAVLLSGFFNLAVVAVAAPLAGLLLRRRRRDLPQVIAGDRAGTVLLGVLAAVLVAIGIANHGTAGGRRAALAAGVGRGRGDGPPSPPPPDRPRPGPAPNPRLRGGPPPPRR